MATRRKEKILLLETQMDAAMSSVRSQRLFMRELFETYGSIELVDKEVHSRADLQKFLDVARRDRQIRAVHLIAHGRRARRKAQIVLTKSESIDLRRPAGQRLFEGLNVECLFLSCCELGRDHALMRRLRTVSRASAVFSYTAEIDDYQAFLTEALFYHLAYGYVRGRLSHVDLREVYEKLKFSLDYLGIDAGKEPLVRPLLAAAFKE